MTTQKNGRGGRRSRRNDNSGGRRRRSNENSRGRGNSPSQNKPQGFFERILSWFRPDSSTTLQPANGSRTRGSASKPQGERSGGRKPELVEVSSPRLYVGNLNFDATESDLFDLFNGVGQVTNAEVVSHRYTQRSKGFAFVQMQSTEEAQRAVEELHDKEFMGRKLVVSGAKSQETKTS